MRREKTRLWWVNGASYGFQVALANPDGSHYLPEVKRTATLGRDLFVKMSDAIKAAEANLQRLADEAGLTVAEMRARLIRESDAGRYVERRISVPPLRPISPGE